MQDKSTDTFPRYIISLESTFLHFIRAPYNNNDIYKMMNVLNVLPLPKYIRLEV